MNFLPIRRGILQTPPCRYNVLVVSNGIVGQINEHPYGAKQIPTLRLEISSDTILSRLAPNYVDIVSFGPKRVITILKHVDKVKKSPYLYNAINFSLFDVGCHKKIYLHIQYFPMPKSTPWQHTHTQFKKNKKSKAYTNDLYIYFLNLKFLFFN